MGKKIISLIVIFTIFILEQTVSCFLFSGLNLSLASFVIQNNSAYFPLKCFVTLLLIGTLTHACIVVVVYSSMVVGITSILPYVMTELKVMSKDPFLHPKVMRETYRSLQLLVGLANETIEVLLPLLIGILMILFLSATFISIQMRHFGSERVRTDYEPGRRRSFKAQFLPIFSAGFVIIIRSSVGKAAEFVSLSSDILNTWKKSAHGQYMLHFLKSCPRIRVRVIGFGFIDSSTFLTLMSIILNYTISTAITL
jgi:hypothetical protein